MNKKYIFTFLSTIIGGYSLVAQCNEKFSAQDYRREILYVRYKLGQDLNSPDKSIDIALLQKHIEKLQQEKKRYNVFFQRAIVPSVQVSKFIFTSILFYKIGIEINEIYACCDFFNIHTDFFSSLYELLAIAFKKVNHPSPRAIGESKRVLKSVSKNISQYFLGILGLHMIAQFISQYNVKTQKFLTKINKLIERDQAIIEQLKAN